MNVISTIRRYSQLVKNSQTIENKWRHGTDQRTSDMLGMAPCSDQNNAEEDAFKDNPYTTQPASNNKPAGKVPDAQLTQKLKTIVNDCLDAVGLLLTDAKYQNSVGLKAFSNNLPILLDMLNNANGLDIEAVNNLIGSLSFYANPANKGTGFDPATTIKTGKYLSAEDYLKQISIIVSSIKN